MTSRNFLSLLSAKTVNIFRGLFLHFCTNSLHPLDFYISKSVLGIWRSSLKKAPTCCLVPSSVSKFAPSTPPIIQLFITAFDWISFIESLIPWICSLIVASSSYVLVNSNSVCSLLFSTRVTFSAFVFTMSSKSPHNLLTTPSMSFTRFF